MRMVTEEEKNGHGCDKRKRQTSETRRKRKEWVSAKHRAQCEWTSDRKGTWTKWSKSRLRNQNPLNIQEKYIVLRFVVNYGVETLRQSVLTYRVDRFSKNRNVDDVCDEGKSDERQSEQREVGRVARSQNVSNFLDSLDLSHGVEGGKWSTIKYQDV